MTDEETINTVKDLEVFLRSSGTNLHIHRDAYLKEWVAEFLPESRYGIGRDEDMLTAIRKAIVDQIQHHARNEK